MYKYTNKKEIRMIVSIKITIFAHKFYKIMKRIIILLLSAVLLLPALAQRRYPIEHLSQPDSFTGGITSKRKVGSQKTAPLKSIGVARVPVVLVQFPDLKFVSDTLNLTGIEHSDDNVQVFFNKYCNSTTQLGQNFTYPYGSHGAVADYFLEQSDSLFQPYFQVIGPVTMSKEHSYYGKDGSDSNHDVHIREFYSEALKLAIQQYPHWDKFDNDGDGKYDFVFFIFAGEGQNSYGSISECKNDGHPEKADLLWPKESTTDFTIDDYTFGGYGITNEMYYERTDGVGTMCHELSHGLGLPDMYDVNYKSFGMDYWDLMDAGNYCRIGRCPCAYNTYERDFMGWRKLVELTSLTDPQTITLEPIQKGGVGYKLVNPANKNEYYILENRQRIGFDSYLGWVSTSHNGFKITEQLGFNHGMLVIHVDYSSSAWNSNSVNSSASHQRMTILPADGELLSSIASLEGYTEKYFRSMAGDLYPGNKNVTEIPSERFTLFSGGTLPINITKIRENEDLTITLEINGGDPTAVEDIHDIDDVNAHTSTYYDMSGRPVSVPSRGLYIKDGKKVFVK